MYLCFSGTAIIFSVICGWFQSYINEETAVQDMHLLTILENGVFTASTLFVFLTDPTKRSHLERELAKWFRSFLQLQSCGTRVINFDSNPPVPKLHKHRDAYITAQMRIFSRTDDHPEGYVPNQLPKDLI